MVEATTAPLCADHPDRPSAGTCARCGRFACEACYAPASGRCVTCEAKSDPTGLRARPFSIEGALAGSFTLLRPCLELAAAVTVLSALSTALEIGLGPSVTRAPGPQPDLALGGVALRFGIIFVRSVTLGAFLHGVLLAGMAGAVQGERVSFRQAVLAGARAWRRLGWANAQILVLVGLGWMFCIVPGVMAMTNLFVAMPLAFLEPEVAPLEVSADLTRGRRWHLFALVVLEMMLLMALSAARNVVRLAIVPQLSGLGVLADAAVTFATTLVVDAVVPWGNALHLATYYGLKASPAPAPAPAQEAPAKP